jgi:hypothetical protein
MRRSRGPGGRRPALPRRACGLGLVGIVAVVSVLAGCGAARSPVAAGKQPGSAGAALARVPGGGSPAFARAFGNKLLAEVRLPHGARRVGPRRNPQPSEVPGSGNLVDTSRFYLVRTPIYTVQQFFEQHVPAGLQSAGSGSGSSGKSVFESVSYSIKSPPAGIDSGSQVLVTLTLGPGATTVIRLDAQLIWYPARSGAEYIDPADFRAVVARVSFPSPHALSVTRTFTSGAIIARLAGLFDGMRVVTPQVVHCPGIALGSFRLQFVPKATGSATVVVTPEFCLGDAVSVGGKSQPELYDPDSRRALAAIAQILGVHRR